MGTLISKFHVLEWCQKGNAAIQKRDGWEARKWWVRVRAEYIYMCFSGVILYSLNKAWPSRKTLILKPRSFQFGKRNNKKPREQVHLSKSCIQAHYSSTGRMSWGWFRVNISKMAVQKKRSDSNNNSVIARSNHNSYIFYYTLDLWSCFFFACRFI